MSTQPPGWYPDASMPGHERWWDGTAWSPVTRPADPPRDQPFTDQSHQTASTQNEVSGSQGGMPTAWGQPSQDAAWGSPAGTDQPQQAAGQPAYQPGYQQPSYQQPEASAPAPAWGEQGNPYSTGQYATTPYPGGVGGPQTWQNPNGQPELASRIRRLFARIIDGILLSFVTILLGNGWLQDIMVAFTDFIDSVPADGSVPPDPLVLLEDPVFMGAIIKLSLLSLVISGLYFTILTTLRGATLGKMALGVRVQSLSDQQNPSWTQSLLRWATTDLPASIPQIGGLYALLDSLWCLWDGKRQCIHDKLPKTVVVKKR